tara:strand:- start:3617 stop:4030 length:414 start_codon:yes stop_codon:yes gene_type:complete
MNVRISYGTELEGIPDKIADMLNKPDRILSRSRDKLDLAIEVMLDSDGKYAGTAVQMLDDLRQSLAAADQVLMEAQTILEGYASATTAQPDPEPILEPEPVPEPQESIRYKDVPKGKDAVRYGPRPDEMEKSNVSSR